MKLIKSMKILRQSFPFAFVDQQMQSNRNYTLVINPLIDIYIVPKQDLLDYPTNKSVCRAKYSLQHLPVVMKQRLHPEKTLPKETKQTQSHQR